jgi:hypothetical protein
MREYKLALPEYLDDEQIEEILEDIHMVVRCTVSKWDYDLEEIEI